MVELDSGGFAVPRSGGAEADLLLLAHVAVRMMMATMTVPWEARVLADGGLGFRPIFFRIFIFFR